MYGNQVFGNAVWTEDCRCNIYTVAQKSPENAKNMENFTDDVIAHSDGFLTKIWQSNMFSAIDMSQGQGYYAISMSDRAKEYTPFCTPTQVFGNDLWTEDCRCNIYTITQKSPEDAKNMENFTDDVIAHSDGFENQLITTVVRAT